MSNTTKIVQRSSFQQWMHDHGYLFRPAAVLTILIGFGMHLFRIIYGDELAGRYVINPTTDKVLLVPMTYATIAGFLVWRRVWFKNPRLKVPFTASLVYIAIS